MSVGTQIAHRLMYNILVNSFTAYYSGIISLRDTNAPIVKELTQTVSTFTDNSNFTLNYNNLVNNISTYIPSFETMTTSNTGLSNDFFNKMVIEINDVSSVHSNTDVLSSLGVENINDTTNLSALDNVLLSNFSIEIVQSAVQSVIAAFPGVKEFIIGCDLSLLNYNCLLADTTGTISSFNLMYNDFSGYYSDISDMTAINKTKIKMGEMLTKTHLDVSGNLDIGSFISGLDSSSQVNILKVSRIFNVIINNTNREISKITKTPSQLSLGFIALSV